MKIVPEQTLSYPSPSYIPFRGRLTSRAEVTGQGQLQATAQGHAVHRRDGRHGQQS